MPYVQLNIPSEQDTERAKWTVFATGFRPFFLGGALLAVASMLVWMAMFFAGVSVGGPIDLVDWHAHEMLLGFTPAIIAGFLLTAVPKWTGYNTPTGGWLAALFGLWLAGRLVMLAAGTLPYWVVAAVELAFLPALAVAIAIPIGRARKARNLGFIPLLFGLAAANALFHLDVLGVIEGWGARGLDAALGIIVVIIAIVGGRVIPFFTASALGTDTPDRRRLIDIAALVLTVGWLLGFVVEPTSAITAVAAIGAGAANLGRMIGWRPTAARSVPLLWVLHAGYAFVGIGLITFGLTNFGVTATTSIALHALTTGAIGILCLGMMARVSLGHTGRPLKAHTVTAIAFALIIAAAIIRVFLPWIAPSAYSASIGLSATLWAIAWVLFLIIYTPILLKPRADGRPG